MNALVERLAGWVGALVKQTEGAEPERPSAGLWSTLTPEQKARARAHQGPENHGDPGLSTSR